MTCRGERSFWEGEDMRTRWEGEKRRGEFQQLRYFPKKKREDWYRERLRCKIYRYIIILRRKGFESRSSIIVDTSPEIIWGDRTIGKRDITARRKEQLTGRLIISPSSHSFDDIQVENKPSTLRNGVWVRPQDHAHKGSWETIILIHLLPSSVIEFDCYGCMTKWPGWL